MIVFAAIRIAVDAVIARLMLGARGRGFWRGFGAIVGADAVIVLLASPSIYWVANRSAGSAVQRTLPTLAAGAVILVAALLVWEDAIWLLVRPRPSRGRLAATALVLLLAALIQVAAWSIPHVQLDQPARVTTWEVRLADLPPAFDGLRICCIGDLHVHRDGYRDGLRRRLRALAGVNPDLILLVGDYASAKPRYTRDAAAVMGELRAPLGVYGVLGNHDRWIGEAYSLQTLREAGVHMLVNESIALARGGDVLYVAGVNDPYTGADDLDAALAKVPAGACVILMAHSPDIIAKAKERGIALVLAGHTHGGQINLPLVGPPVVLSRYGSKYAHGLFREGNTAMFVTRGAGEIFPYLRFNCPREIAVLTLRSR